MKEELIITSSSIIHASREQVWKALTNPGQTKKYMFGCEAVSDWKPGSDLLWRMDHEGMELIAVKGKLLEIDHAKFLSYTVFDPNNNSIEDIPENYLTV